jgi:hypothetical protein
LGDFVHPQHDNWGREIGYTWSITKKADVAEHPKVSNHVGLLCNEPPGELGCSLYSHLTTINWLASGAAFIVNTSPLTASSYLPDQGTQEGMTS